MNYPREIDFYMKGPLKNGVLLPYSQERIAS